MNAGRFSGQSVLITGAATGLGAEAARQFAAEGARLTLVDLNAEGLAHLRAELKGKGIETLSGDVAEAAVADAAVTRAEEAHGRIDHLFCNAGIDPLTATTVVGTTEAQWDAVMAVNVKSAFLFARRAIPGMAGRGGGSIVFTASIAALKAGAGEAAYNVSKAALVQLARSIAIDHARDGIRCNAICPGYLESVMADRKAEMTPEMLAARSAAASAAVPLGREASYAEVARAVLFLSDPATGGYMTGTALTVDGGMLLA
jgi:NAD(P)-dependent dehydrogenase (short-subunit alcohol dehydrogenase family)